MIKHLKFSVAVLLLLLSFSWMSGAHADNAQLAASQHIEAILGTAYTDTDLAHASLARLFGGFIFTPFGGAPDQPATALSKVLGYTNIIAMILGCIIMSYVIVGGAINTAASGELLGRSWSSTWLPMRTTLAFGLIMPATDGSQVFSVAQSLVIWMVIVGSNSGTWLWQKGSDALGTGAPVMNTMSFYDPSSYKSVVSVLNCAHARWRALQDDGDTVAMANGIGRLEKSLTDQSKFFMTGDKIVFPSGAFKLIEFYECGTISTPDASLENTSEEAAGDIAVGNGSSTASGAVGADSSGSWDKILIRQFATALPGHLTSYLNQTADFVAEVHRKKWTAKTVDHIMAENEDKRDEKGAAILTEVNTLAIAYPKLEKAYIDYFKSMSETVKMSPQAIAQWKSQMHTGGWMKAGAWFFEATRFQGLATSLTGKIGQIGSIDDNQGLSTLCSVSTSVTEGDAFVTKLWNGVKSATATISGCAEKEAKIKDYLATLAYIEKAAKSQTTSNSGDIGITDGNNKLTAKKIESGSSTGSLDPNVLNDWSMAAAQTVMGGLSWLGCDNTNGGGNSTAPGNSENMLSCTGMTTDTTGLTSPFTAISAIGHGLVQLSTTIWAVGLTAVIFGGSAGSFPGTGGAASGIYYLVGSAMGAVAGFVAMGFILAYVLPFLPVIAWIMIIIGYLITVVEAVAAAPLAIIMMATPEGEGLSGANMQRAIQMINAIILRPSLSILGLFAAMTVGYVGFALINNLFWTVASLSNGFAVFNFLAIMSLYTALVYKCVQAMIGIMAKIPNEILEWMAGGVAREFGSSIGQDIHYMSGISQGKGEASGVEGMRSAANARNKANAAGGGSRKPAMGKPRGRT